MAADDPETKRYAPTTTMATTLLGNDLRAIQKKAFRPGRQPKAAGVPERSGGLASSSFVTVQ